MLDPIKAEAAFKQAYDRHGGFDMAEIGTDLSAYFEPTPNGFSTFYFDWHLPGRERPPDAIPNLNEHAKDDPLMTVDDYDRILEDGFHRFFNFRRAGVGDLVETAAKGQVVAEILERWQQEYQVPTQADAVVEDAFGLLSQLRGSTNFMLDLHRYPGKVLEVLDILCDRLIAAGLNLAEDIGAHVIILGGSRGSADFISPRMCERFFFPFLVRTAYAVAEAGYRIEYHMDMDWTPMLEFFTALPSKSGWLHLDERTNIFRAKQILGDHLCLKGNLKPSLFVLGTEADVERETKRLIDGCAPGGGLIVSSELTADSRFELVDKMVQVTKMYGVY
jgi:uroporphyrinogen-III decarboxylase